QAVVQRAGIVDHVEAVASDGEADIDLRASKIDDAVDRGSRQEQALIEYARIENEVLRSFDRCRAIDAAPGAHNDYIGALPGDLDAAIERSVLIEQELTGAGAHDVSVNRPRIEKSKLTVAVVGDVALKCAVVLIRDDDQAAAAERERGVRAL